MNDKNLLTASAINRELNRTLKHMFSNDIKGNFLIEILHEIFNTMNNEINKYFKREVNMFDVVTGNIDNPVFEIASMIVWTHKSNLLFESENKIRECEQSTKYKQKLINQVMDKIRVRNFSSCFFRTKQITTGDRFMYFNVPYFLFALCINAYNILFNKKSKYIEFYTNIFNKALAAIQLLEDSMLDNDYTICRTIIEIYVQMLVLICNPNSVDEYDKFNKYDIEKRCCGKGNSDEFNSKYRNRRNQFDKQKINFLHYGWVDSINDYHDLVKNKPYSFDGMVQYIVAKGDLIKKNNKIFENITYFYKMCHAFAHGSVGYVRYPILQYLEISYMLSLTVIHTYQIVCNDVKEDGKINDIDVISLSKNYFSELQQQYNKRCTEKFNEYYKKKK